MKMSNIYVKEILEEKVEKMYIHFWEHFCGNIFG